MAKGDLTAHVIEFENGNTARYVKVAKNESVTNIVEALDIKKPSAVMTIVGGAKELGEEAVNRLTALFSRGIARAAYDRACLVVTGGTNFGVMEMMGQGIADRGRAAPCIGIAPADLVQLPDTAATAELTPLESHHSDFVLVDGDEWGDETETMYRVVRYLSEGISAVTILANGGSIAKKELLYCVRQNRPIIIIEESGRLADEVVVYWQSFQAEKEGKATEEDKKRLAALEKDPSMQEIIEEGRITPFPITGKPAELQTLIHHLLPVATIDDTSILKEAWRQFAIFDHTANRKSRQFRQIRKTILWVGIFAVIFAVASSTIEQAYWGNLFNRYLPQLNPDLAAQVTKQAVHIIALILPVLGSVLLAGANRFHPGENWVSLRGGAEDIKKEIFRYRAKVPPYDDRDGIEWLARKVEQIGNKRVMGGNVKKHELKPYDGAIPPKYGFADDDDGFSSLDGEGYLEHRLQNQIDFFERKAEAFYRNIRRWQWTIYASGGIGTLLGLLGLDAFIAITTSMGAALASYMELIQAEATLRGYNETAQILRGVRARWISARTTALTPTHRQKAFYRMVEDTEHALVTERAGWIDAMQEALKEFQPSDEEFVSEEVVPPSV